MKIDESNHISQKIGKNRLISRYLMLTLGLFTYACAFNLFLLPNSIVAGGVSGIAVITKNIVEPALLIFILCTILLILSYFLLGKQKTFASILGSLLFPVFVKITSNIGNYIQVSNDDLLLVAIFAGVLCGFALGLVFKNGFTTGGTDILNHIVSKYAGISIGTAILINDGIIVLLGGLFFGWTKAMYAIIVLYIISVMADRVVLGISDSKAFYIVTDKEEAVKKYILENLSHGVTVLEATGGYSGASQNILMCVVPTREYFKLKEGISHIDRNAFFVITDSYEVMGGA
jgi:uncharacterized membrane-anchored protein YitT (DUF2179 family)